MKISELESCTRILENLISSARGLQDDKRSPIDNSAGQIIRIINDEVYMLAAKHYEEKKTFDELQNKRNEVRWLEDEVEELKEKLKQYEPKKGDDGFGY